MYSAIIETPIDVVHILARVTSRSNGATVLFLGTVRDVNDGREVIGIEYTAYRSMAERELASIVEEAAALADSNDIAVEHRLGELAIGECSVAVRGGCRDDDRDVADPQIADPVVHRDAKRAVLAHETVGDLAHLGLRHLGVGLVLEMEDALASASAPDRAEKDHHASERVVADERKRVVNR